ncbi:MAG: TolC family protein [Desulfobacterales bacterium]|nr:TolC family protein [Desulfobacterales bacterium]
MKQVNILFVLAFMWISSTAYGYTIDELQKAAVTNRDIVGRYQADVEKRSEQIREAKGNFLPSVDAGYLFTRLNDDNLTYSYKESDTAYGTVAWNVFSGFKDKYDLKATEILKEIDQLALKSVKQDIQLAVAESFLSVYRDKANLKVAEDSLNLYRERYRDVELKYKVGILKKNDLLKIKVEMDNAEQNTRRSMAEVNKSLNYLIRETGVDLSLESLDFLIFDTLPQKADYHFYEQQLMKNRSEIEALKKAKTAAGFRIKSAKATFYPKADISLQYQSRNYDDYFWGDSHLDDDEIRVEAALSINLFDGMKKYARINQAKLEERQTDFDLIELEDDLKTQLKNTLLDLQVAFDNLKVAESSRIEADENLRVTDLAFKQGLNTSTDILDAIFYLSRAQFNVINAYTQVFESYFQLQRLIEGFEVLE